MFYLTNNGGHTHNYRQIMPHFLEFRENSSSTYLYVLGATKHFMMLMICSTGRACLGILLVDRISVQWHELEESTAAAAVHGVLVPSWTEYLLYVLVRIVVVVIPSYG